MLTIGELASYAGVTVRAVRHYHQVGLLPEPERDHSGYRRYGSLAVVELTKIRTLADAGVPLSKVAELLEADDETFAEAVKDIDKTLRGEIQRLQTNRKQIAQLAAGDSLVVPPEVVAYLDRLRELGVTERMIDGERDGWILIAARWPDRIAEWMPEKFEQLEDPQVVRLYRSSARAWRMRRTTPRWKRRPTSSSGSSSRPLPRDSWTSTTTPSLMRRSSSCSTRWSSSRRRRARSCSH